MLKALLVLLLFFDFSGSSFMVNSFSDSQPKQKNDSLEVDIVVTARSGAAYDLRSGRFLWEKNSSATRPIASLTKLITGILLLQENLDFDQIVTMDVQDQRAEGGNRHLYLGERLTVGDLFHAAFMSSDNEAIMALVRTAGYTEDEFVIKMNEWLRGNNFVQTRVFDPTGLDPANVSTAIEMTQIALQAFTKTDLPEFLRKDKYQFIVKNTGRVVNLQNTNELLVSDFGVELGKTGYTEEAGYCFVSLSMVEGREMITVILGADSKTDRFQDTKALLYWLKNNFIW